MSASDTKPKAKPRATRAPKKRADWKPRFLVALRDTGLVTEACKAAGIGRRTAYDARQADEAFAVAWSEVELESTEELEQVAIKRAKEGSDVLLIFMLKSRRPEVYRDNLKIEHAGKIGTDLTSKSDEELRELAGQLHAKRTS